LALNLVVSAGAITIRFGGTAADSYLDGAVVSSVTSQGSKWIQGYIPSMAGVTQDSALLPPSNKDLVDISITDSSGSIIVLPDAFRYLINVGANPA
jgi:hypothetical protein